MSELEAQDPKLAEFLALMAPRSRAQLWANDEVAPAQTLQDLMVGDTTLLPLFVVVWALGFYLGYEKLYTR